MPRACQLHPGMKLHLGYSTTAGLFGMTCFCPDLPQWGIWSGRADISWSWKMPTAVCPQAQIQHDSCSNHPQGLPEADGKAGVWDHHDVAVMWQSVADWGGSHLGAGWGSLRAAHGMVEEPISHPLPSQHWDEQPGLCLGSPVQILVQE